MLEAENELIDTWVDYETARLTLYRDMGTMQLDQHSVRLEGHRAEVTSHDRSAP